jgi:uncharacterized membrane protein YkvA (DUF1232 family)
MSLRVTFELDESDLQHFRLIMRAARQSAARLAPEVVVANATERLERTAEKPPPAFVAERLEKLKLLIRMLTDIDWRLPHRDARRVLSALTYFNEANDLIPDHVPGLGFLDDAIMIELVARELRHELDAYRDFCAFREQMGVESRHQSLTRRNRWLEARRLELQDRMRRRRQAEQDEQRPQPGLFA